ncbi:hypothetical protein Ndes2526B_g03511 [Nannochloris sp. 'desiccata']|nr:hypothetical protein NADE_005258 [Chlorella desiccata (nom. nud.)]
MALSTTVQRALLAIKQSPYSLENATMLLARASFASNDGLQNSMSDGFYEAASSRAPDSKAWPKSSDARVQRARSAQNSLTEHEVLGNSLSEGNYAAGSRRNRRTTAPALSSMSDPDTFWIGSSMSDGYYEMPASLRAGPRNFKRSQSHRSAGPQSLPLMQRVASKNVGFSDSGRLHNSYSASGY